MMLGFPLSSLHREQWSLQWIESRRNLLEKNGHLPCKATSYLPLNHVQT